MSLDKPWDLELDGGGGAYVLSSILTERDLSLLSSPDFPA